MFLPCLVKIVILSIIINRVSAKICENIESKCDCSYTHHSLLWNTHNIHCPKQVNGSAYDFTIKLTDTVSVEVECHNYSALNKLQGLNLDTHIYKVEFKNCFKDDTNFTNYQIELNKCMVNQLNVKIYKTLNIVFNTPAKVDEKTFFNNLQMSSIWNLKVENIMFETSEILRNCESFRVVNFTNTNFLDFEQLNDTGCSDMRIFIIRNTKTVTNLNRANLVKMSKLQEFKIYNCDIVSYNEQMYKDGAIFEGTQLKYLVLESTFNNLGEKILLNGSLLTGVKLYSLYLTDLRLEELPANLLWEQRSLRTLVLNKNRLNNLDANLLINCESLRVIDLSYNNLVRFSDTSIFSYIAMLTEIRLSYNELEEFKFNATGTSNLSKIYLDHNHIQIEGDTCPITGMRNREGVIDLSFNQIIKSRPVIECLSSNKELKVLDVSNNQIIDLQFMDTLPYGRPSLFNTRVNFKNNKITFMDFFNYQEVRVPSKNEVNVYLDSNPLLCHNCLNAKKMFDTKLLHYAINKTMFKIHHPTECISSTSCLMSDLDKTFKCPSPCDCLYNEYTKVLLIDCSNNNLTTIPYLNATELLKLKFNSLHLDLQFNQMTRVSFANVPMDLIGKLHLVNLENNLIESVKLPPIEFPANISNLQLASNRISEIDNSTMQLLNSRSYFLSVTLANNPIVTDKDLLKKLKKLYKFKITDIKEVQENLNMVTPSDKSISNRASSMGLLFGGIIMLFLVVIAGIVMMYSYRRYGSANIFQRLRDQKDVSDMMLDGFQDD